MQYTFEKIIKEYKHKFKDTRMFGVPLIEIDAESLRACVCLLGDQDTANRKAMSREREMYKLFRGRNL